MRCMYVRYVNASVIFFIFFFVLRGIEVWSENLTARQANGTEAGERKRNLGCEDNDSISQPRMDFSTTFFLMCMSAAASRFG